MSGPLFTVLIDTYNYGKYIEDAVDSVLGQDFPRDRYEIIVVDDGSTDDTRERLEKYGEAIQYLRKANGGQASAFNWGCAHARGELVAFLDADDVWLPGKLSRVAKVWEESPEAGMAYHQVNIWDSKTGLGSDPNFVEVSGRITASRSALLKYPMAPSSCLAWRRSTLEKLLPIPEILRSQADAFLTALVIFVAPVKAIPEYLAKYRVHGENLFAMQGGEKSRSQTEHRMKMRAALRQEMRIWLQKNGYNLEEEHLQAYLKQWDKAQEADGFALEAPGRWEYARHLYEFPRIYGENMTARHRIYSYLRAAGALVLGYDHLHVMDEVRQGYKRARGKAPSNPARPEENGAKN